MYLFYIVATPQNKFTLIGVHVLPKLFILAAKLLTKNMSSDKQLMVITVNDLEVQISHYARDTGRYMYVIPIEKIRRPETNTKLWRFADFKV